jgi:hypothetical protein
MNQETAASSSETVLVKPCGPRLMVPDLKFLGYRQTDTEAVHGISAAIREASAGSYFASWTVRGLKLILPIIWFALQWLALVF